MRVAITSSLTKFHAALGDDLGVMAPPKKGTGSLAGRVQFNSHPLHHRVLGEEAAAAKFLAFLHRPEALNGMYKATGFFPADDRFDSSKMNSPRTSSSYGTCRATSPTIGYQNFWPSKMDRENLFLAVQSVFSGTAPQKAAAEVEQRLASWRQSAANELKNFKAWSGS